MGWPEDVMPRDVGKGPPRNGQEKRLGTSQETRPSGVPGDVPGHVTPERRKERARERARAPGGAPRTGG
eukprot:4267974-Pyramimonas_sp.AAC.1